jgi:hypothetical protein
MKKVKKKTLNGKVKPKKAQPKKVVKKKSAAKSNKVEKVTLRDVAMLVSQTRAIVEVSMEIVCNLFERVLKGNKNECSKEEDCEKDSKKHGRYAKEENDLIVEEVKNEKGTEWPDAEEIEKE